MAFIIPKQEQKFLFLEFKFFLFIFYNFLFKIINSIIEIERSLFSINKHYFIDATKSTTNLTFSKFRRRKY